MIKFPLSLHIVMSAFLGYVLKEGRPDMTGFVIFISILLISCGVAVLNNIQDGEYDKKFTRTKHRTLASGKFSKKVTLMLSFLLILTGLARLYIPFKNSYILLCGVIGIIFYNGIYTLLKKNHPSGSYRVTCAECCYHHWMDQCRRTIYRYKDYSHHANFRFMAVSPLFYDSPAP